MRVGIDATPLLGTRSGIGVYTAHLISELASIAARNPGDLTVRATAFTLRGASGLRSALPEHVGSSALPVPARLLRASWQHTAVPPVEVLAGRLDVFHGTNFVAPPALHARPVVTVHDLGYLRNPATVDAASLAYRELVLRAVGRAAVVCTPSQAVADQVCDAYPIGPDRVHVTPLGVEPSWFDAAPSTSAVRRELGLPQSYVLAVGTLEPRKNLSLAVDAYRLANSLALDLPPLVVVGAQGWGEQLDTSGVDQAIIRTGRLSQSDLLPVVAGAAALVFPSIDEGFGLPPLEALATGTAVVASDLPVTREVLADHAVYVDPRSPESLLDGILQVLRDPAGTPDSRRAHAARFTWQACAEATLAAYRQAAAR